MTVESFPDRKREVFREKVLAAIGPLSDHDFEVLQHDCLGPFEFPQMPSVLFDYFREWYGDFGTGEAGLSHENIHESYAKFYAYVVEHPAEWDEEQVAVASDLLRRGKAGPHFDRQRS